MADEKKEPFKSEEFKAYEDGKHRRYELLFAVNGGAFAVAKLFADKACPNVLGRLTLFELSWGMVLFTVAMTADIFMFGQRMRENYVRGAFALPGKLVLLSMGILLCAGWILVGR